MQIFRPIAFLLFSISAVAHAGIEGPTVASSVVVAATGGAAAEGSSGEAAPSEAAPPQALADAATPTVRRTTVFGLPQNMGPGDRILRAAAGAALVSIGAWGAVTRNLPVVGGHAMFAISVLPFLTALTGYCPLYHLLGIENSF